MSTEMQDRQPAKKRPRPLFVAPDAKDDCDDAAMPPRKRRQRRRVKPQSPLLTFSFAEGDGRSENPFGRSMFKYHTRDFGLPKRVASAPQAAVYFMQKATTANQTFEILANDLSDTQAAALILSAAADPERFNEPLKAIENVFANNDIGNPSDDSRKRVLRELANIDHGMVCDDGSAVPYSSDLRGLEAGVDLICMHDGGNMLPEISSATAAANRALATLASVEAELTGLLYKVQAQSDAVNQAAHAAIMSLRGLENTAFSAVEGFCGRSEANIIAALEKQLGGYTKRERGSLGTKSPLDLSISPVCCSLLSQLTSSYHSAHSRVITTTSPA
jgi:hypothetical protein